MNLIEEKETDVKLEELWNFWEIVSSSEGFLGNIVLSVEVIMKNIKKWKSLFKKLHICILANIDLLLAMKDENTNFLHLFPSQLLLSSRF